MPSEDKISNFFLYSMMGSMLVLGTMSTIARKAQDELPITGSLTHGKVF